MSYVTQTRNERSEYGGKGGTDGLAGQGGKTRATFGVRGWTGAARRAVKVRMRAGDAGMTTSEYALGTVAACGFAAVLYRIVTSDAVKTALESVIGKALGVQV